MNILNVLLYSVLLLVGAPLALAVPGTLTYQGRIKNSQGDPLEANGVLFEFSIMNPAGTCTLYRETSGAIDMRNSSGVFDVPIGTGTKNFPADSSFKLFDSFDNSITFNCEGGSTYSPVADDKRLLRVQFHDGTGWKLITPDNEIRSVPFAGHARIAQTAKTLGAYTASEFLLKTTVPLCGGGQYLRHIAPVGTFECATPSISGGNVIGNISGSATGFTGLLSGDISGTQSTTRVDKIKGVAVDMTGVGPGKILKYDGTKWAPGDDLGTSGALTSLTGEVSSTGSPTATVTINNNAITTAKLFDGAVTSVKIADGTIVDADIATGAAIADSKLATISMAGKVSGSAITSGTIGGTTAINTSGLIQTSNGLRLYQGANFVELKAPAGLTTDLSLSLPDNAGSAGQVLTNMGSGVLSWMTPTTGTLTSVGTTAPLQSSGGSAPVISLTDSVAAGTYSKVTVSAKGLVTSGANLSSGDIPNLSGDVTSTSGTSSTKVEKIQGFNVSSTTPLAGQTLVSSGAQWNVQYFGFGQLRSTVTGNLQMPSSCATADKTLTWSAITDTFSCSNIAIANTQVTGLGTAATKNFGTSAGDLVELDGSARIPASMIPTTSPVAGAVRFNSGTGAIEYYNGSAWIPSNYGNALTSRQYYTTPGTYTFVVPADVNKIRVHVAGGGGGGGEYTGTNGGNGGNSGFGTVQASGGLGGARGDWGLDRDGNLHGVGSGGDVSIKGGGAQGGPGRPTYQSNSDPVDGTGQTGGNGGLAIADLVVTPGTSYTVTVGAGGTATGGSPGAPGFVFVEWAGAGTTIANSGSGTPNYVPVWTSSTALNNSPIAVSSGNVGIGTANPTAQLEVNGAVKASSYQGVFRPYSYTIKQSVTGNGTYTDVNLGLDATNATFVMANVYISSGADDHFTCSFGKSLPAAGTTWSQRRASGSDLYFDSNDAATAGDYVILSHDGQNESGTAVRYGYHAFVMIPLKANKRFDMRLGDGNAAAINVKIRILAYVE
ncbi:cell wall anchor protein [Bdellovibrio sp.]|uniref:cell wall anchor protein n=1 Tax=Bdellovibrio sp. TaxID=28201 RepID=UPI0039E529B9